MSFYITNEPNDKDLAKQLTIATPMEMQCGDVAFTGRWLDGEEIWVWGERKKLSDLVNCATQDGRLLRQIQEAHQAGFKFLFLIVEAMYRKCPKTGLLQYRKGKCWADYHINPKNTKSQTVPYNRISGYLDQLRYYLGVHVYHTQSVRETAQVVMDIYSMFQTAPEDHSSLKQFATTPEPVASFLQKPSLARRLLKELPGIGGDKSKDIESELGSAREVCRVLADNDMARLMEIEGIGKGITSKIEAELDENGDGTAN